MLTGQRRTEIGDLRWIEVDFAARHIELPGQRTKNHRRHVVPLSDAALEILGRCERREERDFIFGRSVGGFVSFRPRPPCTSATNIASLYQRIRCWR